MTSNKKGEFMDDIKKMIIALGAYTFSFSVLAAAYIINNTKNSDDTKDKELYEDIKYIKKLLHKIYFCEKINLKNTTGINIDEFYKKYQTKLSEKILGDIDIDNEEKENDDEEE